jgi:hypothetical protein
MYKILGQKSKYGAKKIILDGIKFDSQAEAEYYALLKFQKSHGLINDFECQPKIYLSEAKILYKPDFLVTDKNGSHYVDVKGMQTAVFRIKCRLWRAYKKEKLVLVKKQSKVFKIIEEIN